MATDEEGHHEQGTTRVDDTAQHHAQQERHRAARRRREAHPVDELLRPDAVAARDGSHLPSPAARARLLRRAPRTQLVQGDGGRWACPCCSCAATTARCGRSSTCAATAAPSWWRRAPASPGASPARTTPGCTTPRARSSACSTRRTSARSTCRATASPRCRWRSAPASCSAASRPACTSTSTSTCAATTRCSSTSTSPTAPTSASRASAGPNWKLAYDGYLDFYHLPILHKDTFGPTYNNKTINDAWGPHQRNVQPDERYLALAELPEDEWQICQDGGGRVDDLPAHLDRRLRRRRQAVHDLAAVPRRRRPRRR